MTARPAPNAEADAAALAALAGSDLRGVSSAARTLDAADLDALRPASPPARRPRPARKITPAVTSGIICLCGQRFGEDQALEFMRHLRAEVASDLRLLANVRRWRAATTSRSEYRQRAAAGARQRRRDDPEWRERQNARGRQYKQRPASIERRRQREAERRTDPAWRERRNAAQQARREATGQPCACGCGEATRGALHRPGHHMRSAALAGNALRRRSEPKVARARELRGQGMSTREIAADVGVHRTTVQRWLARPRSAAI